MSEKIYDWKEITSSYYDKCLAMMVLFAIFAFIVFPNVETTATRMVEQVMETIEILPEIPEEIKPPEEVVKPIVSIEIVDEEDIGDDEEIEVIDTIEDTTLPTIVAIVAPPTVGATSKFVVYEEAPVVLRRVPAVYTDMARKMRIQGQVILEVEILSDGSIGAVEVFKSLLPGTGGLDESAITAIKQWQYQPAKSGGQPVACWIKQPFTFEVK